MLIRLLLALLSVRLVDAAIMTLLPVQLFAMPLSSATKGTILGLESAAWVAGLVAGGRFADTLKLKTLVNAGIALRLGTVFLYLGTVFFDFGWGWYLATAALLGLGSGVTDTPFTVWIARVARDENRALRTTNSYRSALSNGAMILGPLLATVALAAGMIFELLIGAVSLIAVAGVLITMTASPQPSPRGSRQVRQSAWRYLLRNRWLVLVLGQGALVLLLLRAPAKIASLELLTLHDSGEVFGVVNSVQSTAAIGGTLLASRLRPGAASLRLTVAQAFSLAPLLCLLVPWVDGMTNVIIVLCGFGLGGLGVGIYGVVLNTLLQAEVDSQVLGRVYAVQGFIVWGADPLALGLGGLLLASRGAVAVAAMCAAVGAPSVLISLLSRRLRSTRI